MNAFGPFARFQPHRPLAFLAAVLLPALLATTAPAAATPPPRAGDTPAAPRTDTGAASGAAGQDQVFNVILVPQGARQPGVPAGAAAGSPHGSAPGAPRAVAAGAATPAAGGAAAAAGAGGSRSGGPVPAANGRPPAAGGTVASLLWLLPAVLAVALLVGRFAWRRRPRRCADCGGALRRLDREAAFAELDMAERTEHLIGDVNYEVFQCSACGRIEKHGAVRNSTALAAAAPPVGSAAFLRRHAQSGLSIWSPKTGPTHAKRFIAGPSRPSETPPPS